MAAAAPAGESVIATPADATPPQIAAEEAIESGSQAAVATPTPPQAAAPDAALPEARLPQLRAVEPAAAVAAESAAPAVTPAVALDATGAQPAEPTVPAAKPAVPAEEPAPNDVSAEDIIKAAKQGDGSPMPARPDAEPSNAEPAEPAEATEPVEPAPETPSAPKRENLFEEFEEEADQPDEETNLFDDEPVVASESDVPAPDESTDQPAEPAEPADQQEPAAAEPDPFDDARHDDRQPTVEPLRRWVDASGEHATVGALVDLRGDAVEILKANGRTVVVPLGNLSVTDRAYAAAAGARLAAGKAAAPDPADTAGL